MCLANYAPSSCRPPSCRLRQCRRTPSLSQCRLPFDTVLPPPLPGRTPSLLHAASHPPLPTHCHAAPPWTSAYLTRHTPAIPTATRPSLINYLHSSTRRSSLRSLVALASSIAPPAPLTHAAAPPQYSLPQRAGSLCPSPSPVRLNALTPVPRAEGRPASCPSPFVRVVVPSVLRPLSTLVARPFITIRPANVLPPLLLCTSIFSCPHIPQYPSRLPVRVSVAPLAGTLDLLCAPPPRAHAPPPSCARRRGRGTSACGVGQSTTARLCAAGLM